MKLKNIFIGLLLMTFTSCNDWFDVTSSTTVKGDELFKSEQGFKDAFTGVYSLLVNDALYGRELTYGYNDIRAKYWNVTNIDHRYFKTMNYDYTDASEVGRINAFWSNFYKAISNVNAIIENVDKDKKIFAPGMYNIYKGEAHALRAMLHFEVLRLYGVSPKAENAMETRAIPYYEKFTNIAQPTLPMKEVFKKIVADIEIARDLLRDYDPYGPKYNSFVSEDINSLKRDIKMNYWAATALLARVELYAGNKTEALNAAKEIIGEVGETPKAPFNINETAVESRRLFNTEMIFWLDIQKLDDKVSLQFGDEVTNSTSSSGLIMKTADVDKLFKLVDGADQEYRKSLWMKTVDAANQTLCKYDKHTRMPMIRLSELYYIAAECASDNTTAFGYLNAIRAGRGLAPLPTTTNFDVELKTEYMREFFGEGQFFYYLKRIGATTGIGLLNKTIKMEQYVLPLSVDEIDFGKVE